MKEKLYRFLSYENKMAIVKNYTKQKAYSLLSYLRYAHRFKTYGWGSVIAEPDRMFGLKSARIGEKVLILHHLRMEVITEYGGKKFTPDLVIGDGTSVGQNFHVVANDSLIIGASVTISGNVFISTATHCYKQPGVAVSEQELEADRVEIGDYSFIGFGASIQPGVILGKQCIVGTNAVVLKGIYPEYSVLAGVPAKIIRRYNKDKNRWERVCGGGDRI